MEHRNERNRAGRGHRPGAWRWRAVAGALALGTLAASSFALAQKVAPSAWVADPTDLPQPYGPTDQKGAMNLQTRETVASALGLATRGEVVSLAVPLNRRTAAYGWRRFEVFVGQNEGTANSNNEDYVSAPINTGTNFDGLAHMGIDGRFYGGRDGADIQRPSGLAALGIENAPAVVARGVFLDIASLKGVDRVPIGTEITVADIEAAMQRQGIDGIREGDVVIFHTGHRQLFDRGRRGPYLVGHAGPGIEAAEWLAERGVVAVGGDTGSVEVIPNPDPDAVFPVHQILLTLNGVHIIENLATERLADGTWNTFLFVAAPLPITGASSSWVNPLAIR